MVESVEGLDECGRVRGREWILFSFSFFFLGFLLLLEVDAIDLEK